MPDVTKACSLGFLTKGGELWLLCDNRLSALISLSQSPRMVLDFIFMHEDLVVLSTAA